MSKISMIVFDLSGTTVSDDNAVAKCLHEAALAFDLKVTLEDFKKTIGTNKIHLYEFMIAKTMGEPVVIEYLEKYNFPHYHKQALRIFGHYSKLMVDYYKQHVKSMPGAEKVFEWCKQQDIKVVTDTGFHDDVNTAIMEGLQWLEKGLVDLSLDVEDTDGIGRPAPYMIYQAMKTLGIQNIHEVIKIGDTPADLLSGYYAGCIGNIGVLSGANSIDILQQYPHTHILNSVAELPDLINKAFID